MAMNRIQFQAGLSMGEFLDGTELKPSAAALEKMRWPHGFAVRMWRLASQLRAGERKYWQCSDCARQAD